MKLNKQNQNTTIITHTCSDSVVWDVGWPTFPYPCPWAVSSRPVRSTAARQFLLLCMGEKTHNADFNNWYLKKYLLWLCFCLTGHYSSREAFLLIWTVTHSMLLPIKILPIFQIGKERRQVYIKCLEWNMNKINKVELNLNCRFTVWISSLYVAPLQTSLKNSSMTTHDV